jgi:hypothetical protein
MPTIKKIEPKFWHHVAAKEIMQKHYQMNVTQFVNQDSFSYLPPETATYRLVQWLKKADNDIEMALANLIARCETELSQCHRGRAL